MTETTNKNLSYPEQTRHIKRYMGKMRESLPELMDSFFNVNRQSYTPGSLDTKTKELIALALGVASRCDDCIAMHTQGALQAGATKEEIIEMLGVTVAMGGGPSLMYATHVLVALEQFEEAKQ